MVATSCPEHDQQPYAGWNMADIVTRGAESWPDRLAVVDTQQRLTFRELQRAASAVADRLVAVGVQPGDRVVIAGERGADTLVATLGACLAGATYVPLDPEQPQGRFRFCLDDACASALIASARWRAVWGGSADAFIEIGGLAAAASCASAACSGSSRPRASSSGESVAYIMYTSGTTGLPKGVQIEHQSVRAFFDSHNERVDIRAGDRCLGCGPFHFDVALMEVFLPLDAGACVYFASRLPVPRLVLDTIERHRITHFYAVGSVLAAITGDGRALDRHDLRSLRSLSTGAEVCSVRTVNAWLSRHPGLAFLNSYGPTEATVGCISHLESARGALPYARCPIGLPHAGTQIALLHGDQPVRDAGVIGELAIAGPQLMRGYWRRPAEDERVFLWLGSVRYYRSGDHAYRDDAGQYHFVGRRDDEIKVNGQRLHLSEVLHALHTDSRVEAAVAGLVQAPGEPAELGVVVASPAALTPELAREVEGQAAARLTSATRPRRFGFTRALPRLSSGKVDRRECLQRLNCAVQHTNARHFRDTNGVFIPFAREHTP